MKTMSAVDCSLVSGGSDPFVLYTLANAAGELITTVVVAAFVHGGNYLEMAANGAASLGGANWTAVGDFTGAWGNMTGWA